MGKLQRPFWFWLFVKQCHPNRAIRGHTGPYGAIRGNTGKYVAIRGHRGPYYSVQNASHIMSVKTQELFYTYRVGHKFWPERHGQKQSNSRRCMYPSKKIFWMMYLYESTLLLHNKSFQQNLPKSMKYSKIF